MFSILFDPNFTVRIQLTLPKVAVGFQLSSLYILLYSVNCLPQQLTHIITKNFPFYIIIYA